MEALVEIIASRREDRGTIYTFRCGDAEVEILFLDHSIERAKKWQLSIEQVGECLLLPDEVLIGHFVRYIAHKVIGKHLIRAVYEYVEALPVVITVYFPYLDRYFQGGSTYEDKILK
ncbi:MAG: hypothetical protein KAU38_02175 [Desulfobacterales bacterium]|nr:hypothetical protein [Desulfobacterales bacterium]